MSLLNYNQIPGYAEAVRQEEANRELAFLQAPLPICGIPIRHFNARHHILLGGCGNRFLVGGLARREDVAIFLWFLSPDYQPGKEARDRWVGNRFKRFDFEAATDAIREYLGQVMQDWPASGGGEGEARSYYAPIASLVDLLASQYGWTDESILEMPLRRVFQYCRAIEKRLNPKTVQFNRSDRLVGEYLQRLNRTAQSN